MVRFGGILVQNRIIVPDIEDSRSIFSKGYYGKPLGIPKPKDSSFESPLILDVIEGYYLVHTKILDVYHVSGKKISLVEMKNVCRKQYVEFDRKYQVFKNLRNIGYVVSPGIKFGCDFAVYERGPGIDHAPYLVQVVKPSDNLTSTGIVLAGRLATTVKKQFILAIPFSGSKKIEFIGFDWWKA